MSKGIVEDLKIFNSKHTTILRPSFVMTDIVSTHKITWFKNTKGRRSMNREIYMTKEMTISVA